MRSQLIENWESRDEPEHLKTIRDRLLADPSQAVELLELYLQVWEGSAIAAVNTPVQTELLLSGLIVKEQDDIRVRNQIYASIFNRNWVERSLAKLDAI